MNTDSSAVTGIDQDEIRIPLCFLFGGLDLLAVIVLGLFLL